MVKLAGRVRPGGPLRSGPMRPRAGFAASVNGFTAAFVDLSDDARAGGTIVSWSWDFGDAGTSLLQNPTRVYAVAGIYTVSLTVTDNEGLTGTTSRSVTVTGVVLNRPFIVAGMWANDTIRQANTDVFSGGMDAVSPSNIIARLDAMKAQGKSGFLNLTTGHTQYIVGSATYPKGVFDIERFKHGGAAIPAVGAIVGTPACTVWMDAYNTAPIKARMALAVTEKTLLGCSVMDEPPHQSWNNGVDQTNYPTVTSIWMTKAKVDLMVDYCKALIPGVPFGVACIHSWQQSELYTSCDFIVDQYELDQATWFAQPASAFLAEAKAQAALDKVRLVISINYRDGGDRIAGCPLPQTGGPGSFGTNCQMTATQLRTLGLLFGQDAAVVALNLWAYHAATMAGAAYQQAFSDIAAALAPLAFAAPFYRLP